MNLRKSSKRPLTPPPNFRKIILQFISKIHDRGVGKRPHFFGFVSSVPNSSDGLIFVRRQALDVRFMDKNTGFRRVQHDKCPWSSSYLPEKAPNHSP